MKSASLGQKVSSERKSPRVIVQETENCVEPGSLGPPRGDKENLAIALPDFLQNLGNENGWGIGVSDQLVPRERKRVYCPCCCIVDWTYVQR